MKKTTELVVHNDVLVPYLTNSITTGGLGWVKGQPNQITPDGLLHPESLYRFLSSGNDNNVSNWKKLVSDCGGVMQAQNKVVQAITDQVVGSHSVVDVFRDGVRIDGCQFSMWNRPHQRGSVHSQRHDFGKNELLTVSQVTVSVSSGAQRKHIKRIPDQAFYINGLLFSMMELKANQTQQSATDHGRAKIVGDFQEFAFHALQIVRFNFEQQTGSQWPGLDTTYSFADATYWRNEVMRLMPFYMKAAWLAALDMKQVWMVDNAIDWLVLCDKSLSDMLSGKIDEQAKLHPRPYLDPSLTIQMKRGFSKLPDVSSSSDRWEGVKEHLNGLLSPSGVAREIKMWHQPLISKSRAGQRLAFTPLLRPRAPQRVAVQQIMSYVDQYYANEHNPHWAEQDLRHRLQASQPSLSPAQIDEVVEGRLKYKNGQDAYSVLVQGAAGLGKTNIAVWTALELHGKLAPLKPGDRPDAVREQLFDRIVILTDRVALRSNIAEEAERSGGSKNQVLSVESSDILTAALTGAPLPSKHKACDILVVNLQKFPSLHNDVKSGEIKIKHTVGRTAFIIDEVHRSQNGNQNQMTLEVFLDEMSKAASSSPEKKNLIVGLTATPSDPILARFGQWRPGVDAADKARWVSHFSYAMKQAVEDGYVLNALKGMQHFNVQLDFKDTATIQAAGSATKLTLPSEKIYENKDRQRKVARRFCEIFADVTMQALPYVKNKNIKVGRAKAMVTVPTIQAAVQMVGLIREELRKIAKNHQGKAWSAYRHVVKDVADHRVFILYTSSASSGGPGPCGLYNPSHEAKLSEEDIIDGFRCKGSGSALEKHNSIIVVVDKLLTGFDEPTLHTLMIDRQLNDISLFQAMCRVNRMEEGKTNCLILDMCHDESNWNEAHRVFERYGSLSSSSLDGLDLLSRLRERRAQIAKWPDLKNLCKKSKVISKGERAEEIHRWTDNLLLSAPDQAKELRKLLGGYLSDHKLGRPLMNLDKEDLNNEWLSFIREIHSLLRCDPYDKDTADVIFDVQDIEWDALNAEALSGIEKQTTNVEKNKSSEDVLFEDWKSNLTLSDQLDALRDLEEHKAARAHALREFLAELFKRMDAASARRNNDEFRRDLADPNSSTPYDQVMKKFISLFDGVVSDRSWISKNDKEKKIFKELCRGRLELLLGDYRMR